MKTLIKNATLVNEGKIFKADLLTEGEKIAKISEHIPETEADQILDATGKYLLPGIIDDHVHFREPGLTEKADMHTESRAAAAGGVTSFIEQPNTIPNVITLEILEDKYKIAAQKSWINYGFSLGGTNTNLQEILNIDSTQVPAVKLFLGASTGNMLVDDPKAIEQIFRKCPVPVCVHCEDNATIQRNTEKYQKEYGDDIPVKFHPLIRSEEGCYISTEKTIRLAKETNARLHIYHMSTAKETGLLENDIPLAEKRITAEVCPHYLYFTDADYATKGKLIKWNPAIKTEKDKEGLWEALLDGRIDVIGTDHAPHEFEKKQNPYMTCPSGAPLVQHSLPLMLEFYHEGKIKLETLVEKMCHNPAILFNIEKRGYLREGYQADLVLVDMNKPWTVAKENILYKCGWSPLEGKTFHSRITHTFVNGHLLYEQGIFSEQRSAQRLTFER